MSGGRMKQGDVVVVIETKVTGEVVDVSDSGIKVRLQDGTTVIKTDEELKRRKKCVCGMSASFLICDGSHSGQ